jgi:hypothetical protein
MTSSAVYSRIKHGGSGICTGVGLKRRQRSFVSNCRSHLDRGLCTVCGGRRAGYHCDCVDESAVLLNQASGCFQQAHKGNRWRSARRTDHSKSNGQKSSYGFLRLCPGDSSKKQPRGACRYLVNNCRRCYSFCTDVRRPPR